MTKLVAGLAIAVILLTQVEGGDSTLEVDLQCPEGWLATNVNYYQNLDGRNYKNVSTCLICRWNSVLYHPFTNIDICFSSKIYFDRDRLNESICNDAGCKALRGAPYCGVRLTITNHNFGSITKSFSPCKEPKPVEHNRTKSVDLICPQNTKFISLLQKKTYQSNSTAYCVVCGPRFNRRTREKQFNVTMCCSPFHYRSNQFNVTQEEMDSTPLIKEGLHCGSKFTQSSLYGRVNVSNYVLCSDLNTNEVILIFLLSSSRPSSSKHADWLGFATFGTNRL